MAEIREIMIRIGMRADTKIEIGGVEQTGVVSFAVKQDANEPGPAKLELVRVLVPAEGEDAPDIVIEGIAEIVELFGTEAQRAAAEQRMAVGSFYIHEKTDDPIAGVFDEIINDAKRYRALRRYVEPSDAPDLSTSIAVAGQGVEVVAVTGAQLDTIGDTLRRTGTLETGMLAKPSGTGDTVN